MPLPFILGAAAIAAAIGGVGTGVHGAVKMKEANDTMKSADARHKKNLARFEKQNKVTNGHMDKLGTLELKILKSFEDFSNTIEKIHNRPEFKEYEREGVQIPKYDGEKLKEVSIGAGVLLGGIGGAAAGTAGGFAAAGATTAAVMALGTASTGTAIASLSGVAATNAALAALGGGALAAGGGGMALGTTILGASTLGVGLLIGGVIFNIAGSSLSNKADEAWSQMKRAEEKIDKLCVYMNRLSSAASRYAASLTEVNNIYQAHLTKLKSIVSTSTDWEYFTEEERIVTENTVLLVGLLYEMCKVKLVLKAPKDDDVNVVNKAAINRSITNAKTFLAENSATLQLPSLDNSNGALAYSCPAFTVIEASHNEDGLVCAQVQVTNGTIKPGDKFTVGDSDTSATIRYIKSGFMPLSEIAAGNTAKIYFVGNLSPDEILGKIITLT